MKSILIISSIYPGPGVPVTFTPVVHYFAREFVALGYDVRIIVSSAYYPKLFYRIPTYIKNKMSSILGFSFPSQRLDSVEEYVLDGISICRIPIYKRIPKGSFAKRDLDDEIKIILSYLERVGFKPDVIAGHWSNPQLYLVAKLGDLLKVKTALIAHEHASAIRLVPDFGNFVNKIDVWGFRSQSIKRSFLNTFNISSSFQCNSGVPHDFFRNIVDRNFRTINRVVFVGNLIKRKYPEVALQCALDFFHESLTFNIVGDGPMMGYLSKLAKESSANQNIILHGRLSRTKVIEILDDSDIFVMVSRGEVFGLVYLEAMARGCIVIASKNEGMEGIIRSGENGFLVNAGDPEALEDCLNEIQRMSPSCRKQISLRAMETAKMFSDSKVAMNYISAIIDNDTQ